MSDLSVSNDAVDEPSPGLRVLILGAAGMIGRRLAASLAQRGRLGGSPIASLTLADVVAPADPGGSSIGSVETLAADITEPKTAARLIEPRPDVVFHLAAIVSSEAEADFDKGYAVNLDATRWLFEAIRSRGANEPYRPRVVFSSSIAVFGAPFPDQIGDEFFTTPSTSYGTQKAIGELLLTDYSRRGFLDGVGLRLPTICIRPGAPNRAASGFFSSIMREPLVGQPAVLPVSDTVRHWFASPRSAVGFLERAGAMDTEPLGHRRVLNMPGLSATVADQIDALRRVAGQTAVELIRHDPDPAIAEIIASWPQDFDAQRAQGLGFVAETSFDEILQAHIEDELGGQLNGTHGG